jgi:hypothetical protein
MKISQDKNSSITRMTILSIVVLSVIFLICAPHLSVAQSVSNNRIEMLTPVASSVLAASYSLADLAGTWNVGTLASGPAAPYWFRGRITVVPDGSWTGLGQDYGEPVQNVSGNFKILADATITLTADNVAKCGMDSGKTVIACTETWKKGEPGTSNLIFFTKEAAFYSLDDLTGQWEVNILVSGLDAYNWERGPAAVDSDGTFTMDSVNNTGSTFTTNDTFAITPEGLITMQEMPTAECRMDISKTVIVCTDTWDTSTAFMLTMVKKGDDYTMADLTGSWFVNALASGPGAPWWERGPVTIRSDGSFTGKIEDYDGTTSNMAGSAGTFTISSNGIIDISGVGDDEFRCAMNSAKTVFICTGTWQDGTTEMKIVTRLPPCTYTISPLIKTMKANGGSASVKVTAEGTNCAQPSLTPGEDWISASVAKWSKNKGSIKVTALENDSSVSRDSSLIIEGNTFTITQKGQKCIITSLTPKSFAGLSSGGDYSFAFTVYPEDCEWTATPNDTSTFLHVTTGSGEGSGNIDYSIDPNTAVKSRSGKITLFLPSSGKKKTFSVKQAGQ